MASPDPVLHLIAGPNGAGKTTLATRVIAPVTHLPFINADVIAAQRWPDAQAEHAYDASQVAAEQRRELIGARASFITETVFSHPSSSTRLPPRARRPRPRAGGRTERRYVAVNGDAPSTRRRARELSLQGP